MRIKTLLSAILGLAFVVSGLAGCRTVKYSEMSPAGTVAQLLPPLEAKLDTGSFESVFGGPVDIGNIPLLNPNIHDIGILYRQELHDISEDGLARGVAVCSMVDGTVVGAGVGLILLSAMTAFLPNLLGMPFAYAKTTMQLEMRIFDTQGNLVGLYNSNKHRKRGAPVGFYYGWNSEGETEFEMAGRAFRACMADIKGQIELDHNRLNDALRGPGRPLRTQETPASLEGGETSETAPREPSLRDDW